LVKRTIVWRTSYGLLNPRVMYSPQEVVDTCSTLQTRKGHIDAQYWEKVGGEMEGVWVFAAELAVSDDPENVARCVWQRVKRLEGIVEDDSDWPDV
jgi:hypothetical protein